MRFRLTAFLGDDEIVDEISDEPSYLPSLDVENDPDDRVKMVSFCAAELWDLADILMSVLPTIGFLRHNYFWDLEEGKASGRTMAASTSLVTDDRKFSDRKTGVSTPPTKEETALTADASFAMDLELALALSESLKTHAYERNADIELQKQAAWLLHEIQMLKEWGKTQAAAGKGSIDRGISREDEEKKKVVYTCLAQIDGASGELIVPYYRAVLANNQHRLSRKIKGRHKKSHHLGAEKVSKGKFTKTSQRTQHRNYLTSGLCRNIKR